jgi:hypothetical protein
MPALTRTVSSNTRGRRSLALVANLRSRPLEVKPYLVTRTVKPPESARGWTEVATTQRISLNQGKVQRTRLRSQRQRSQCHHHR